MSAIYSTSDGNLHSPDNEKNLLHEYHNAISDIVDVDVVGVTGRDSKIRVIVLSEQTDVSELEIWIGQELRLIDSEDE